MRKPSVNNSFSNLLGFLVNYSCDFTYLLHYSFSEKFSKPFNVFRWSFWSSFNFTYCFWNYWVDIWVIYLFTKCEYGLHNLFSFILDTKIYYCYFHYLCLIFGSPNSFCKVEFKIMLSIFKINSYLILLAFKLTLFFWIIFW